MTDPLSSGTSATRPTDPNDAQWDAYEEDGILDLEDQLENALDRAAFENEQSDRQGDLIALFRAEY
jgi:hypothetical protein